MAINDHIGAHLHRVVHGRPGACGARVMFGGTVIASFSWAMLFGVVIGTYSSIFIAAPVLIYFGLSVGQSSQAARDAKAAETADASA